MSWSGITGNGQVDCFLYGLLLSLVLDLPFWALTWTLKLFRKIREAADPPA
jgi:hypothetical protein